MFHQLSIFFGSKFMEFIKDTTLVLILWNAYLTTAPEELPTFREFPQWFWSWNLHALRSFISSRLPAVQGTHAETTVRSDGSKKTITDTLQAAPANPASGSAL